MENINGDDPSLWSIDFENVFVQILVELVNSGRIVNGLVHVNLWSPITSRHFNMIGWTYIATQSRIKFSHLKMNHYEFFDLINHRTGFSWDPDTNSIHGTDTQ